MPKSNYVIAISGYSGAGKSTIIQNLVNVFGDAVALGIDDYAEDAIYPPAVEWINNGADPNEFITPRFVSDLRSLKNGKSIIHPESKSEIHPAGHIIVEEPFGKSRTAMKPLIDFHAQIEIPPEIALARRVLRNIERSKQSEDSESLAEFLGWYLKAGREFYIAVHKQASKDKDITIDGKLPSETIAQKIVEAVKAKRNF